MQFANIFALAACLTLAATRPTTEDLRSRVPTADITFNGAAGAQYTLTVPLDGSPFDTNNDLSISTVSSTIDVAAQCTLNTVDYPPALVEGPPGTWAVGPPQTVISISCTGSSPPVQTINVEFDGAAGAKYSVTVPLNGDVVPTNNALSISTIVTTYAKLPSCNIDYVDFPATLVNIATDTWAVGPPQTVISIQCWP